MDEKRTELLARLQTAAELEMATIPSYLTALLSIKRQGNRGAAENIRSVMTEEMLHLTLVANVMASIGGAIRITKQTIPEYPFQLTFENEVLGNRQLKIHLERFSENAITNFMEIERPRIQERLPLEFSLNETTIPEYTIGEFYDEIITLLEDLHSSLGPSLFIGKQCAQVSEDYYWSAGGKPIAVSDLATAKAAMHVVIQQGEGASGSLDDGDATQFGQSFEVAHYYRFREIYCRKRYRKSDKPWADPTGDPLNVDYDSVYPIKTDAKSADYQVGSELAIMNDDFNRQYTRMLIQLEEGLTGNPKLLYTAIMNGMHGLSELGIKIMATQIPQDPNRFHGCPTFEWLSP